MTSEQTYLNDICSNKEKIKTLSEFGICAVLGFVLGPLCGCIGLFINLNFGQNFAINYLTFPGWWCLIGYFTTLIGTKYFFKEIPKNKRYINKQENA